MFTISIFVYFDKLCFKNERTAQFIEEKMLLSVKLVSLIVLVY